MICSQCKKEITPLEGQASGFCPWCGTAFKVNPKGGQEFVPSEEAAKKFASATVDEIERRKAEKLKKEAENPALPENPPEEENGENGKDDPKWSEG